MGLFQRIFGKGAGSSSATGGDLRVSDFISEKRIAILPQGPSKQQVFGSLLAKLDLKDPNGALKALLAREEAGSTVIAPGLALPHARIPGIVTIQAALGISQGGVVDPKAGEPIHVFVLFLGPSENMRQHLAFLAAVSALFQTPGLVQSLVPLTSPKAVLAKIRETEATRQ